MAFTDFIQLQRDIAHALLSEPWLNYVNVVTREEIIENGSKLEDENLAAEVLCYDTMRNGKKGCGIIVEKPEMAAVFPNQPGPQGDLLVVCLVLENWADNYGEWGTNLAADQVAQKILDIGHLWVIEGVGPLRSDDSAIVTAKEWEPLRAYKARLRVKANRGQTERVQRVSVSIADQTGIVTLSTATAGADIYYTTDGSFPGPSNATAQLYDPDVPPTVIGTHGVLRSAGFKDGMIMSAIAKATY